MFRKRFMIRRKGNEESRQARLQETTSHAQSPNISQSEVIEPVRGKSAAPVSSLSNPPLPKTPTLDSESRKDNLSQRNNETDPGPLGLNVIYTPENRHKADIVFVHGLGGTSRMTWSKHKNPELFWPLVFLPLEPAICQARILTFGYNANFRKGGNISTSVLDFAKDLLFDLKYAKDKQKEDLDIGNVPLIFVVHSMGGLVVKEAYMQGQNDPEYESIIKAVSAITFLATPHRGTNLAEILNLILRSTVTTNSKQYISELARNSFTLQRLNEQFRHIAPRLHIVSFYETQPCSIGLKKAQIIVVKKDSSVLGYPGEISKALNADHHNICKFDSPKDPNYIAVRNVLISLINKIISTNRSSIPILSNPRESRELRSLLAINESPDADFIFFRDQWAQGTSGWILKDEIFLQWLQVREPTPDIHLLWLNGGAATGKSVLSSFVINSLVEKGHHCQYFFLRFGDQKKRTLSMLLRSIAYQIAQSLPDFSRSVVELVNEAIDFENTSPRAIWERIFKSIFFNLKERQPLYWIIDGIDEADEPKAVIKTLSDIAACSVPLRILLVSRKTPEISASLERVPERFKLATISIEGHVEDLRCYIRQELSMPGGAEFKERIAAQIVEGAENNFLWIRLAVEKLNLCHTHGDVELALQQLPLGMEELYDRMALSIAQNPSTTHKALALNILQYVSCSLRVLTVAELSQALGENSSQILDFQRSIVDLCGGFVVLDNSGNVAMIHQTAREYLLSDTSRPFHVDGSAAHEQIFLSCMRCLMTVGLRGKVNRNQKTEFLDYAASSWSSHLNSSAINRWKVEEFLNKFLTRHWILTWIHVLASDNQLRVLIQASKHLSIYSAKRKSHDAVSNEIGSRLTEQALIDSWAADLVRIVGRFGTNLRRNPESIYKLIPPFCPPSSSIYQLFGKQEEGSLKVSGLSRQTWDDSLARLSFGLSTYASCILAAGAQIAILDPPGTIFVYDSSIFQELAASPINHGEYVSLVEFNSTGTLLVTYGYRTTKVWEVLTGKCRVSVDNIESQPPPLAMVLANNSTMLLVGTEDRRVRSLDLTQSSPNWQFVAALDEPEIEGHFSNSASYMVLNRDATLIALAYRGHPISISAWEIDGPTHVGHYWRKRNKFATGRCEVIKAMWHPLLPELFGLYNEGVVFKWRPYDDEVDTTAAKATALAITRDGNLLATGDVNGEIKVYITSSFTLIYQLASQDPVLGLAFSPDSRRFYDLRGDYGNTWEPNALMSFTEQTGKFLKNESLLECSMISTGASKRVHCITAIAASPIGRLYCFGTEEGTVSIHDIERGKISDVHISKNFWSIEQICWSKDGQYICFSDICQRVYIVMIALSTTNITPLFEMRAKISIETKREGPILQLLFHPDSNHLLVYNSSTIFVISLISSSITHSSDFDMHGYRCIVHPQDPSLIVGIGPNAARVLDWTLTLHQDYELSHQFSQGRLSNPDSFTPQDTVDQVLITNDKQQVLVQISLLSQGTREKIFLRIESSSFSATTRKISDSNQGSDPTIIIPSFLPPGISSQIELVLTFLSHDRLIFLCKNFSICSSQIPSASNLKKAATVADSSTLTNRDPHPRNLSKNNSLAATVKEHFSLPGDWISTDCLTLSSIWEKEKSLLCPRNGEVAVVRCAALI